jgi:hypothetical protein
MVPANEEESSKDDLLNRKLTQLSLSEKQTSGSNTSKSKGKEKAIPPSANYDSSVEVLSLDDRKGSVNMEGWCTAQEQGSINMDMLLPDDSDEDEDGRDNSTRTDAEIRHAPLVFQTFNPQGNKDLLPQYGLLGTHNKEKLFLNTNIPFSAFICGVQGSGKSHTVSCILENVLIPSDSLGRLDSPLSALVFSYGHFNGDGSGFSISEAAFLAVPNPTMRSHSTVKMVHVLVSPSNYARIARLYNRIPNVIVTIFKFKPWTLDIGVMLTLMNVSDSKKSHSTWFKSSKYFAL